MFLSFSSIFNSLQPFFSTLAALSRFSRYSSSETTKKSPQGTPRAPPNATNIHHRCGGCWLINKLLKPSAHHTQLQPAGSRFPSFIQRVIIFRHFAVFASKASLGQEHPKNTPRDTQSTPKGDPEESRRDQEWSRSTPEDIENLP